MPRARADKRLAPAQRRAGHHDQIGDQGARLARAHPRAHPGLEGGARAGHDRRRGAAPPRTATARPARCGLLAEPRLAVERPAGRCRRAAWCLDPQCTDLMFRCRALCLLRCLAAYVAGPGWQRAHQPDRALHRLRLVPQRAGRSGAAHARRPAPGRRLLAHRSRRARGRRPDPRGHAARPPPRHRRAPRAGHRARRGRSRCSRSPPACRRAACASPAATASASSTSRGTCRQWRGASGRRWRAPTTPAGAHHLVVELDALADDGPRSLADVAERFFDPSRGLAIVTEGLLNYFDRAVGRGRCGAASPACCRAIRYGLYLSDLHLGDDIERVRGARAFAALLSVFARGRVHFHYADAGRGRARAARRRLRRGALLPGRADRRPGDPAGADLEAATAPRAPGGRVPAMSLEEDLRARLTAAIKAKDLRTANVIRMINTKVMERRTAAGFKGTVDDDLVRDVIAAYKKSLEKAREEFAAAGEQGRRAHRRARLRDRLLPAVPARADGRGRGARGGARGHRRAGRQPDPKMRRPRGRRGHEEAQGPRRRRPGQAAPRRGAQS